MKIIISGNSGTGKTYFGDWLEENKNFFHLNLENWNEDKVSKSNWNNQKFNDFVKQDLQNKGNNVVLTWGFPPNPPCLEIIKKLEKVGILPIWFDAPIVFCKEHWKPEPNQSEITFNIQVDNIIKFSSELKQFYGKKCINVVNSLFKFREEKEIYNLITDLTK